MPLLQPRLMFFLAFAGCSVLMLVALYLQHGLGLEPCPLCYVQRAEVVLFGTIALLAFLHNPQTTGRRIYASLLLLTAAGGIATAGRQLWLQHLPKDQLPECLPPGVHARGLPAEGCHHENAARFVRLRRTGLGSAWPEHC